jgi:CheY-like chemotaxis protein
VSLTGTVLLVEDEADLNFTLGLALEMDGYEVLRATSGEEALALLAQRRPDAILLDIRLPGIDGWEVLRRLGEMALSPRVPVVLLSAQVDAATAARAEELGCHAYLAKPFNTTQLGRILQAAIGTEH